MPPPPQVCGAVHVPQLTVRATPQLSVPASMPQLAPPRRAQNCVLVSAVQPHTFGMLPPPHVVGAIQTGPLLMKWPIPSQTRGCCPAQAVAFGLQSLQRPVVALQVMQGSGSLTHAVPVALQVCGVLPMQRRVAGWQIPVHVPAEQTFGQTMLLFEFAQWPVASQSCG
jgi:hypothetical protein